MFQKLINKSVFSLLTKTGLIVTNGLTAVFRATKDYLVLFCRF